MYEWFNFDSFLTSLSGTTYKIRLPDDPENDIRLLVRVFHVMDFNGMEIRGDNEPASFRHSQVVVIHFGLIKSCFIVCSVGAVQINIRAFHLNQRFRFRNAGIYSFDISFHTDLLFKIDSLCGQVITQNIFKQLNDETAGIFNFFVISTLSYDKSSYRFLHFFVHSSS